MGETELTSDVVGGVRYGVADVHIHSSVGDGMADVAEIIRFVEEETELDVIAITDHDDVSGGYQARELAANRGCRFEVVIGTEVTTLEGHILGLYVDSAIPSHQPLEKTIKAIHKQGGLCIVPHPMSWLTQSVSKENLERVLDSEDPDVRIDAIETVNATIVGRISNRRAAKFNQRCRFAETGGSDAHFVKAVGGAYTIFPGRSAADLRRSILERTCQACNGKRVTSIEIGIEQIVRQQIKSKGLSLRHMLLNLRKNLYEDRPRFPI